ncbi:MAG: response regulator transcription factor [Bacteroidetes bacterium]|nr:response regulator transcription factor [Bacteroidota bacterium]
MRKIAIVEDENSIAEMVQLNLSIEGYETTLFEHGGKAKMKLGELIAHDLILLDVMLPEVDGIELCRLIRAKSDVPIIMLSAKGSTGERIEGLRAGANDYVPKPFDLEELLLRIKNLLPEVQSSHQETMKIGDVEVNFATFEFFNKVTNEKGSFSKREIELLELFKEKKDFVVSRDEILDRLWGKEHFPTARTIDNYILAFRKTFEKDPRNPVHFHSIRGVGYRFKLE